MADQSANLSGMLSQIGKTVGSMGDAYKPVSQALSRPKGSMDDPDHLQRLAQWASSNGDTAQASLYMSQARELKAEQKEQKNIKYNADTYAIASDGTKRAGEGDVTNLDRNIAMLQERVANATSTQQQAQAQRALEAAQASRKGAVGQQNKNHAQAVTSIDKALADPTQAERKVQIPQDDGTVREGTLGEVLRDRKEELLKNPEVQSVLNDQRMEAFRVKQVEDAMEEQAYLDKNMPALRNAVNDPREADRIISEAPPAAQDALRQTFNSMRTFQKGIEETEALFADVKVPSDMKSLSARVDEIPEELRAGPTATLDKIRDLEGKRDANGGLTEGDAIALKNARNAHTASLVQASNAIGQQEYAARRGEERRTEAEVQELRESLETYRPSDLDISRRAGMLAEASNDYVKVGADKKGKGGRTVVNTGPYMEAAAAELRQEHRTDVNKQIALKTGEEMPVNEEDTPTGWANPNGDTITQDTVDRGLAKVGKKQFITTMRSEGYTDEQIGDMIGEALPEEDAPAEPKLYRREPGLPKDIFGLQSKYDQNVAGLAARRSQ